MPDTLANSSRMRPEFSCASPQAAVGSAAGGRQCIDSLLGSTAAAVAAGVGQQCQRRRCDGALPVHWRAVDSGQRRAAAGSAGDLDAGCRSRGRSALRAVRGRHVFFSPIVQRVVRATHPTKHCTHEEADSEIRLLCRGVLWTIRFSGITAPIVFSLPRPSRGTGGHGCCKRRHRNASGAVVHRREPMRPKEQACHSDLKFVLGGAGTIEIRPSSDDIVFEMHRRRRMQRRWRSRRTTATSFSCRAAPAPTTAP